MFRCRCAIPCTYHPAKHAEEPGCGPECTPTFSLKGVETPFSGTALLFLVAAALWLVYLVPIWMRRSEYLATERNAARLGQTLRLLAETNETTEEIRAELSAREIAKQHRIAERKLKEVSYTKAEVSARRRRILRSTTTFFTVIGLFGLLSSISLQAAFWVTVALAGKTLVGFVVLAVLARQARTSVAKASMVAPAPNSQSSRTVRSTRAWTPPTIPAPLSARQAVSLQESLPSREELLRKARIAAAQARPEEAAAEAKTLAPVSQFDQMGRVPQRESGATHDLDEVLRRRRAV